MLSLEIVFLFLCVWTVSTKGNPFNWKSMDNQKASEAFTCLNKVFCDARKPEEFFGIMYAANDSVQVTEDIIRIVSKSYSCKVTAIEDDWLPIPDYYCPMSLPEKTGRFADFMTEFAVYYEKYDCELQTENEYCIALDKTLEQAVAVIQKYEDLNICGVNPENGLNPKNVLNPKKMVPFG